MMGIAVIVLLFVAVIFLGPMIIAGLMYLLLRRRAFGKQQLRALQNDIEHIRTDIEEIKVQIADFIIKTH